MVRFLVAFVVEVNDRDRAESWAQWVAGYQPVAVPCEVVALSALDELERERRERGL